MIIVKAAENGRYSNRKLVDWTYYYEYFKSFLLLLLNPCDRAQFCALKFWEGVGKDHYILIPREYPFYSDVG